MPQKAKLGQNFLADRSARSRIVEALGDISNKTVVEIGPGKAAITELLAQKAHRLVAVELDRELAADLKQRFAGTRVEVMEQDILTVDLASLANGEKLLVVGNLPYYIMSDILLHLFRYHSVISRAVVMMQREVADRVAAAPGSRDYGLFSATTQLYARVEKLMTLPPGAFSPPPKVHSSVLRLTFAPRFSELRVDAEGFITFLRQCFAQKRKTLMNNLRTAGFELSSIAQAAEASGISPQARAEAISLEGMARLYRGLMGD